MIKNLILLSVFCIIIPLSHTSSDINYTLSIRQKIKTKASWRVVPIVQGTHFSLQCKLKLSSRSDFGEKIFWTRNNKTIAELARNWKVTREIDSHKEVVKTKLMIHDISMEHAGEYRCAYGVNPIILEIKPKFVEYIGDMQAVEGSFWEVECYKKNKRNFKLDWTFNGGPLGIQGNKLTIQDVRRDHSGLYKCTNHRFDAGIYLEIIEAFNSVLSIHNTSEGSEWHILCHSKPGISIFWSRNNEEIPELASGEIYIKEQNLTTGRSVIGSDHGFVSHSGIYTCSSTNITWELVITNENPINIFMIDEKTLPFTDLKCNYHNAWLKDGEKIENLLDKEKNEIIMYHPENKSISIKKEHPSVYGRYVCGYGNRILIVPPLSVAIEVRQININQGRIELACVGNMWSEANIRWNYYPKNLYTEKLRDHKRGVDNGTLLIHNLKRGDKVSVLCEASYKLFNNHHNHQIVSASSKTEILLFSLKID